MADSATNYDDPSKLSALATDGDAPTGNAS